MVTPAAIANIFAYPVSMKTSLKISNYIVKVLAPRVFSILSCYKKFRFVGYKDNLELLPDQFIIISNHQSLIDIPCYMRFFRTRDLRFVAKAELGRHIPLVSEMLRGQKHCLISRKASAVTAMRTIEKFGKQVIDEHQIPVLFPEGTRSKDGNVGKFYSAGFRKLCDSSGLPVAVCALDGGWRVGNLKNIMTNLENGSYQVKVLKVYDAPKTREAQQAILDEAPVIIQKQLDEWRA